MKWYEILDKLQVNGMIGVDGINRILLVGPPGTGKSSWPVNGMLKKGVHRAHLTEDSGPEDLVGTFILKNGSTEFIMGPGARAMSEGEILVLDEIDRGSSSIASILHGILDDHKIACITLPTGEKVSPKGGYVVFGTMNGNPGLLDEALLDRFDLVLVCKEPHPGILKNLPREIAGVVDQHYAGMKDDGYYWNAELTARSAMAFSKLRKGLGVDMASVAVWGRKGPEIASVFASQAVVAKSEE